MKVRACLMMLWVGWVGCRGPHDSFFKPVDTGASLPADRVYPQGRIFPFMGFSGNPSREATNGFTVAGPGYGLQAHQSGLLARAKEGKMPFVYGVGLDGLFVNNTLKYEDQTLRTEIARQVRKAMNDPAVAWWYLRPEELRMWRRDERNYLRLVYETVHATDPQQRPVWMYDPNHRNETNLMATGEFLDIIGKGSYVNLMGFQNDRVWVRWSIDQETGAAAKLEAKDGRRRMPLLVAQLSEDPPNPADDDLIPAWVRHDVYLGLMANARGVAIWSLFRRNSVQRTYDRWYNAYAQVARELTGPLDLGQVFLFAEPRADLRVNQTEGPREAMLRTGARNKTESNTTTAVEKAGTGARNKTESNTTTAVEKAGATPHYPALMVRELAYGSNRYLFLCNSSTNRIGAVVEGIPRNATLKVLFGGESSRLRGDSVAVAVGPWGVQCLRISRVR
jgi:hypothetical protein